MTKRLKLAPFYARDHHSITRYQQGERQADNIMAHQLSDFEARLSASMQEDNT